MSGPINLNYATPTTYAKQRETPFQAFDARGNVPWKGDRLFRIYLQPDRVYFIKIGGSRTSNAAVGVQFGLLGALFIHLMRKREQKKTEAKINQIGTADPQTLLSDAKENFTLEYTQIQSPLLRARSFFDQGVGKLQFVNEKGKKKTYFFDDVPAMRAAVEVLTARYGPDIASEIEWNEVKQKFRKRQV